MNIRGTLKNLGVVKGIRNFDYRISMRNLGNFKSQFSLSMFLYFFQIFLLLRCMSSFTIVTSLVRYRLPGDIHWEVVVIEIDSSYIF
jgi:hypothetical protein